MSTIDVIVLYSEENYQRGKELLCEILNNTEEVRWGKKKKAEKNVCFHSHNLKATTIYPFPRCSSDSSCSSRS